MMITANDSAHLGDLAISSVWEPKSPLKATVWRISVDQTRPVRYVGWCEKRPQKKVK